MRKHLKNTCKGIESLQQTLISNHIIFETQCRKPLIFQTYIIWSYKSHSLKYQRFTTLESKDIGIRNQSLWQRLNSFISHLTPWQIFGAAPGFFNYMLTLYPGWTIFVYYRRQGGFHPPPYDFALRVEKRELFK